MTDPSGSLPLDAPALAEGDFHAAARSVLAFLHRRLGLRLWMVNRNDDGAGVVLAAEDHGYGVTEGQSFPWSDTFCSRMIAGLAPRIAPDSSKVPVYRAMLESQEGAVGAYVGVPIEGPDGIFGTLCAIDPEPQPSTITAEQPLIELLAGLLGNILQHEREADEERRRAEEAERASMADPLTGLTNRRGWDLAVAAEEDRARRFGDSAAVLILDLDGLKQLNDVVGHAAGDELLQRTAHTLRMAVRPTDIVARIGGDEFAVLATGGGPEALDALLRKVRGTMQARGIRVSAGGAMRDPLTGLDAAIQAADAAMYVEKRRRAHRSLPYDPDAAAVGS